MGHPRIRVRFEEVKVKIRVRVKIKIRVRIKIKIGVRIKIKIGVRIKINVKGSGQECPLYIPACPY